MYTYSPFQITSSQESSKHPSSDSQNMTLSKQNKQIPEGHEARTVPQILFLNNHVPGEHAWCVLLTVSIYNQLAN